MKKQKLEIDGMTCGHCVMSVKKELSKIDGVTITTVSIGSAEVAVDEMKVTEQSLRLAVEEAGYSVISIQ
ncbi:MAG: heavy-metal-associated domain-containing protein [Bacteroidetes bacterium]|nr:heavy-metal-associated domain-containing protein [Bacteroidota bacterium]